MDSFKKGWFTETGVLNSSTTNLSIRVDQIIHEQKSDYQNILVFQSELFGRCLVLDDAIQCTEKDEFSYQEMIAFLPLNSHRLPQRVLIIGGGDGGVVREVVKHPLVEQVVMCEIDPAVVDVSKRYLPFMSAAFDDPKLRLLFEDGYEFVKNHPNEFDVIITDSSDPKGPAECLFQEPYYRALYRSLRTGGIICCQAESYWFDLTFIKQLVRKCRGIFQSVRYGSTQVPSYPSGQIGFLVCSKDQSVDFADPVNKFTAVQCTGMQLRYYTSEIHTSAFRLPPFVQKELDSV
ncbi:spermidine synthase-like [Oppia nitens]|uniref:spermidine synthase-like n=1 Tax=Oppia nitens TaxID=1686743 RepID=UPI0023DA9AAA|nr:spermidine synthase-like [Oppia nitens]